MCKLPLMTCHWGHLQTEPYDSHLGTLYDVRAIMCYLGEEWIMAAFTRRPRCSFNLNQTKWFLTYLFDRGKKIQIYVTKESSCGRRSRNWLKPQSWRKSTKAFPGFNDCPVAFVSCWVRLLLALPCVCCAREMVVSSQEEGGGFDPLLLRACVC